MAIIKKYYGTGKIPSHYKKTKFCPKCGYGDSTVILEDHVLPYDKNLKIENVKKRICGDLTCGYEWMHPRDEVMLEQVIEARGYSPKVGQIVNCKNCDEEYKYFNPYLSKNKKHHAGSPQQEISFFTALRKKIGKKFYYGIYYDSPRILFVKEGNCPKCLKKKSNAFRNFLIIFTLLFIIATLFKN